MESLHIIDKFCTDPLAIFLNMAYIRNVKQSFADVPGKRCSLKIHKFHRKTSMLHYLFKKVAGLKTWNFIKKRLQHRCFPVKFA